MCAAPSGNQFWKLRSKHGRDRLFANPQDLWEAACEYFEWCDANPFIKVEQSHKAGKPYFDEKKGEMAVPPDHVKLPVMRPYTLEGLCIYLDVNTIYFNNFETSLKGKEDESSLGFSKVITRIREVIRNQKFSGAASGFFNANIIARDLGLRDATDITSGGDKFPAPQIILTIPAPDDEPTTN